MCSDIEDLNEDEASEQNNLKDGLSVTKLMEMIEDTMQSEQEEVDGKYFQIKIEKTLSSSSIVFLQRKRPQLMTLLRRTKLYS